MTPSFNAADFLASLTSRFQTLEDLQTELQDLLKSLSKELVDLVNDNYTDFLSLGDKLKGGEDRVEEIRVGLLGFQRDVTGVRNLIQQRSLDIKELLEAKKETRREIRNARNLLEIDERLKELEVQLKIIKPREQNPVEKRVEADEQLSTFDQWPEEWLRNDDEMVSFDEQDINSDTEMPSHLLADLQKFQAIQILAEKCGIQSPFVLAQRDRVSQVRDGLRREFEIAIRNQPDVKIKQKIIQIRSLLDDE